MCKGGEDISREACGSVKMGCFRSAGDALRRAVSVYYEVKVVDCDPKPAKKLRSRTEVESKFQYVRRKVSSVTI